MEKCKGLNYVEMLKFQNYIVLKYDEISFAANFSEEQVKNRVTVKSGTTILSRV